MTAGGREDGVVVLYVDSDADRQASVSTALTDAGDWFSMRTAAETVAAREVLAEDHVDCVVATDALPDGDPFALVDEIRAVDPDVPVVLYAFDGSEALAGAAVARDVAAYASHEEDGDSVERLASRVLDVVAARTPDGADASADGDSERAELERDSRILNAIFEYIPEYLYVKDEAGRHVRVSTVNEEAESYLGKTDLEIWGEEGQESYEDDMRVIEAGEQVINEEDYTPEWNHYHLTSKVPWRNENGEIQGLIGITRDVTHMKRHEQQLERQNERLRTVASVISHDIRNPLQVAKGRLSLAQDECDSQNLDDASDALDRMATLLEELLAMVKHGQWVEETEVVSLESLARDVWATATTAGATLEFEQGLDFEADPVRLGQLLENLFRNASMHGGDDVTVRIGPLDSWAGFYVEDDGPGIPEDERETVFNSGYTTSADGTGFGLSIVQVIAEAHGWEVSVTESTLDDGSADPDDGESAEDDELAGARFEFGGVEWP